MNNGEGLIMEKGEETNVITDLLTTTPLAQANEDRDNRDDRESIITGILFSFYIDFHLISR